MAERAAVLEAAPAVPAQGITKIVQQCADRLFAIQPLGGHWRKKAELVIDEAIRRALAGLAAPGSGPTENVATLEVLSPAIAKPRLGDCANGVHCWSTDGRECLFCFKTRPAPEGGR